MPKDEWMRAAMLDDMLVVELLVRLKQSQAASPLKSSLSSSPPPSSMMFPLRWSVRMPRSKAARCDAQRKRGDSTRCSPTTPLSWSGGASPSGTGDGFEESSRPVVSRSSSNPRSKGTSTNELATTNTTASTTTKGSRRKKTFAELKEEEGSLLKERMFLRKELATLRATFKEQRAKNESLKRMKLDFELHSSKHLKASVDGLQKAISGQLHQRIGSPLDNVPSNLNTGATIKDDNSQSDFCDASRVDFTGNSFLLPDLNMAPSEDDFSAETFCGMS